MTTPPDKEKFATDDLVALRNDLLQAGLDSFQAGELISAFLMGRGYGVSQDEARHAAMRIEGSRCSVEALQSELEGLALMM